MPLATCFCSRVLLFRRIGGLGSRRAALGGGMSLGNRRRGALSRTPFGCGGSARRRLLARLRRGRRCRGRRRRRSRCCGRALGATLMARRFFGRRLTGEGRLGLVARGRIGHRRGDGWRPPWAQPPSGWSPSVPPPSVQNSAPAAWPRPLRSHALCRPGCISSVLALSREGFCRSARLPASGRSARPAASPGNDERSS